MKGLFPNLPDEIGRECLLRVPYIFHENLKKVCKSWEALVNSPQFYKDRKRAKTSDELICLVNVCNRRSRHQTPYNNFEITVYDPLTDECELKLCSIPIRVDGTSNPVAVNQKLFMIWGQRSCYTFPNKTVIAYDFSVGRWNFQVADMPLPRYLCACSASPEGLIFIVGGSKLFGEGCDTRAAVYNVEENKWYPLPDMNRDMHISEGHFLDGKFYVNSNTDMDHIEVFDTNTKVWSSLEWTNGWSSGCVVSAFGHLYSFKREGVMEYDCKTNVWRLLEPLPNSLAKVSSATVWRDQIFLSGIGRKRHRSVYYYTLDTPVFYMYKFPNNWIRVKPPPNFSCSVQSAVTLDI